MLHDAAFDHLPFPVFSADPAGLIVYKNRAAMRHIGTLRRGSRILRHLLSDSLAHTATLVSLKGEVPYPHALMVRDETEHLFLCPARLQYPDAEEVAAMLLRTVGSAPADYRTQLAPFSLPQGKEKHPRLYAEMKVLSQDLRAPEEKAYSPSAMAKPLFESTAAHFGALGYRIRSEIDAEFAHRHPVSLNRFDLLFFFGILLCTAMKLSENGDIRLMLTSDTKEELHLFQIKIRTALSPAEKQLPVFDLFLQKAPTLVAELSLLGKAHTLFSHAKAETDLRGELSLTFSIPYLAAMLPVQSPAMAEEEKMLLRRLFSQMESYLKENSSFC